jgi:hypothetical protein
MRADVDVGDFNLRGRFRPRLKGTAEGVLASTAGRRTRRKKGGDSGTKWLPARYGQWLVHGTHPTTAQRSRPAAPLPTPGASRIPYTRLVAAVYAAADGRAPGQHL